MPAYSYKRRFVPNIRVGLGLPIDSPIGIEIAAGTATSASAFFSAFHSTASGIISEVRPKRQTIRADRARHARPGETIQHYCGMRTKGCFKIGEGRCTFASQIKLIMNIIGKGGCMADVRRHRGGNKVERTCYTGDDFDAFARADGFENRDDMMAFWRENHGEITVFEGVLIEWEPCK